MTQSSFQLGVVLFAGQIPALVLAPATGVLVDRWDRHRVLLATQTLAMIQALLLALLTGTGRIEVWQLRQFMRPIYVDLKILPPIGTGIATAGELGSAMKE